MLRSFVLNCTNTRNAPEAVRPLRLANAPSGLSESCVEEPVVSKAKGRVEPERVAQMEGNERKKFN